MTFRCLLLLLLLMPVLATSQSLELMKFLRDIGAEKSPEKTAIKLPKLLIGSDGRIHACSGKNLFAFESNGTISWFIPLSYICNVDIAPVADEGEIYLVAENRVLKIKPLNIGTSKPSVEIFFGPNSSIDGSGEIIGLSISVSYLSLFINIKNRGLFTFSLHGQLIWSAGPMLYRFGYRQGCKKNMTECYFDSAPVVDQYNLQILTHSSWGAPSLYLCTLAVRIRSCDRMLISNSEGQLYSLYIRSPNFRWIQDFSSVDKLLIITAGNNGRLYITFPRRTLLMALDVSTGNILWQNTVGPLSKEDSLLVVDSNGWISIGSLDGFLYSFSPTGEMRKFLERTASDSVLQASPVLDCSGFAIYTSQTMMGSKSSRVIDNYTYISAMNPMKVVLTLLAPATGAMYWTSKFPGELSDLFLKTDLRYFALDERVLLTFLASASQRLAWTCAQGEPKFVSVYTGNERAVIIFVLFQFVILVLLAALVRFCCIFWRKKKLQDHGLGKFLEKRRCLHRKRKELSKMISELEQEAAEDATTNEVLEQLGEIVKAKEGVERKLSTSYSLGRDSAGSQGGAILPLYDGKSKSHSFHSAKKESVTIFNTLSDDDTRSSGEGSSTGDSSGSVSGISGGNGDDWHSCGDLDSVARGKAPAEAGPSDNMLGSSIFTNPMQRGGGYGGADMRGEEELVREFIQEGMSRRMWLKRRRALSSSN